jgi:ethanolamine ammonia-lyase small subunit
MTNASDESLLRNDRPDNAASEAAPENDWPELVGKIRARTPARLLAGRAGVAYRTMTQMDLREAHAAARDAVRAELDLEKQFDAAFIQKWELFEVSTAANSKDEYLLYPNLGRTFCEASRSELTKRCPSSRDIQIAIGDGLSVTAVAAQVPALLPELYKGAEKLGWTVGQAFVIRHCRVGILNEIGELLNPSVAVLLIGERPGLATAESLSAYMAFHPNRTHTDADRNLISNIHARGVSPIEAAAQILDLADQMMRAKLSGTKLQAGATGNLPK